MIPRSPYRAALSMDELDDRAAELASMLEDCTLCPHTCHVNRRRGEHGVCRTTETIAISSAGPHYGEEPPLVGSHGSGTIFFCSCNLKCQYCQNYEISQLRYGRRVATSDLARIMLHLQDLGCHNINLVTPTHVIPQIVSAIAEASRRGLSVPIVYNCGGYESLEVIRMLDGIIDIYMPDVKYSDNRVARQYSGAPLYWDVVRPVLKEMHRQVGDLDLDEWGIAWRGLLVRHLVLPEDTAGTEQVMEFIAREISPNTYVNIMDQYHPSYRIARYPALCRPLRGNEFISAVTSAEHQGLRRGFEGARQSPHFVPHP